MEYLVTGKIICAQALKCNTEEMKMHQKYKETYAKVHIGNEKHLFWYFLLLPRKGQNCNFSLLNCIQFSVQNI